MQVAACFTSLQKRTWSSFQFPSQSREPHQRGQGSAFAVTADSYLGSPAWCCSQIWVPTESYLRAQSFAPSCATWVVSLFLTFVRGSPRYLTHFKVSDLQKHCLPRHSLCWLAKAVLPIRQTVVPDNNFALYFILVKLNRCKIRNWGWGCCMPAGGAGILTI